MTIRFSKQADGFLTVENGCIFVLVQIFSGVGLCLKGFGKQHHLTSGCLGYKGKAIRELKICMKLWKDLCTKKEWKNGLKPFVA